jgi:hypothetical protein
VGDAVDVNGDTRPGHIISYATIEKFLWSEMRLQALAMRDTVRSEQEWEASYQRVHRKLIQFLRVAQRKGRRAGDKGEEDKGAPYYTGFFVTVIGESYANGETHVRLTPEHVVVLKDMLKDYGMLECRRSRKDPECTHKRRGCDFAEKFEECLNAED